MGGDFGPEVVIPAAALALDDMSGKISYIFFGDENRIKPLLGKYKVLEGISEIHHTSGIVTNDEKPSVAIRRKDTSLRLAIEAVKEGRAQSIVSAGNTGALMATAKLVLRCLPGIKRPALASVLPTRQGDTVMLDLGANLVCDAQMLVQFAVLGSVYARVVKGIDTPRVGILNVGSEDMKGPDLVREAASILTNIVFPGDYYGFVEGDDLAEGLVDVVVTDGFTGNIALKVAEGVSKLTSHYMKEAFLSSLPAKMGAVLAGCALKKVKKRMDPRYYNGGMFLGLDGICVKSHGGMDVYGVSRAILVAAHLVEQGYNSEVAHEIALVMNQQSNGIEPEGVIA